MWLIKYYVYYEIHYLHKEVWNLDVSYGLAKKLNEWIKMFWFRKYVHILSKFAFLYNI